MLAVHIIRRFDKETGRGKTECNLALFREPGIVYMPTTMYLSALYQPLTAIAPGDFYGDGTIKPTCRNCKRKINYVAC